MKRHLGHQLHINFAVSIINPCSYIKVNEGGHDREVYSRSETTYTVYARYYTHPCLKLFRNLGWFHRLTYHFCRYQTPRLATLGCSRQNQSPTWRLAFELWSYNGPWKWVHYRLVRSSVIFVHASVTGFLVNRGAIFIRVSRFEALRLRSDEII